MKIHFRINDSNPGHTRFTVFINGGNCGELCMRTDEFHELHQIMALGVKAPIDEFVSSGRPYIRPEERGE